MNKEKLTSEYIKKSWAGAVKKKDVDPNFIMPYDYIPPCVDGDLINLYYWDTYFTNKGLYIDGLDEYAFGNIQNLRFALNKFGCVPNMCRANGADYASQPPLLFLMVKDYYARHENKEWLAGAVADLEKEYDFWMTKRTTPTGLNRYGCNYDYENGDCDISYYAGRVGLDASSFTREQKIECNINRICEGESGEDHTPRFSNRAFYVAPIDLNCYLYAFECTLAEFCRICGKDYKIWQNRAENRLALIVKYCFDEESGLFFDYDYEKGVRTGVYCAACYLPFVFGISNDKTALSAVNAELVLPHGVASCQKVKDDGCVYQWGYPNSWAPHNFWAYEANKAVGLTETAEKIRKTYLDTLSTEFVSSGKLYEKYDGEKGGKSTVNEYGLPEMLGWTAGVYEYFYNENVSKTK